MRASIDSKTVDRVNIEEKDYEPLTQRYSLVLKDLELELRVRWRFLVAGGGCDFLFFSPLSLVLPFACTRKLGKAVRAMTLESRHRKSRRTYMN